MNRLDAMSGLISYRLSKTVNNRPSPMKAMVRGVPIYIGADDGRKGQQGATGLLDTGFLSNIPDAIQQTNTDIEVLRNEVYSAANFGAGVQNKQVVDFYVNVIVPFLKDWNQFSWNHTHGWRKFADNWITFGGLSSWNSVNEYRQRLLDIRDSAEKIINFTSPRPAGPSVSYPEKAGEAAAGAIREVWKVLKWVLIIAIAAIGGSILLYGIPSFTMSKAVK